MKMKLSKKVIVIFINKKLKNLKVRSYLVVKIEEVSKVEIGI